MEQTTSPVGQSHRDYEAARAFSGVTNFDQMPRGSTVQKLTDGTIEARCNLGYGEGTTVFRAGIWEPKMTPGGECEHLMLEAKNYESDARAFRARIATLQADAQSVGQ